MCSALDPAKQQAGADTHAHTHAHINTQPQDSRVPSHRSQAYDAYTGAQLCAHTLTAFCEDKKVFRR